MILPDGTNSVKLQLCLCSLLLVVAPWIFLSKGNAADFTGPIVSALDGDSIEVLHKQHPERIRLSGIDCPEKDKAFGTPAKQAASALVFGKDVMLQTHGHDKSGRTIADVLLPDGTHVNQMLVKEVWRWKYAPGDTALEGLEMDARQARIGLWADPQPVRL